MNFLKQFLVVGFLSIQFFGYAQSSKLDGITQKYDSYLNELNVGMGVLIKKKIKQSFLQSENLILTKTVFSILVALQKK